MVVFPVPDLPTRRIERFSLIEMIRCSASSGRKGNSSFSEKVCESTARTSERSSP